MRELFITGVGTGVGKTLVTTILCHQLTRRGRRVRARKPLVSGFSADDPNSDPALILRSLGQDSTAEAIEAMSPWRFTQPISPHLAARREGRSVDVDELVAFCRAQGRSDRDFLLVEGAGGVMTPIDSRSTCLDLIVRLGYPVILVTGTYLGALSHTLTALHALRTGGAELEGIVVSESLASTGLAETIESLEPHVGNRPPVSPLPRLGDGPDEKWLMAPEILGPDHFHDDREG